MADNFVAVRLGYWQLYQGQNSTKPGPFLRKIEATKLDTGDQVLVAPDGRYIEGPRSWKNKNGFTAQYLLDAAKKHGGRGRKDWLRLSWFLIEPESFRRDLGGGDPASAAYPDHGFTSPEGAISLARQARRPLVRVDGDAASMLDGNQEFLSRHIRQFMWHRGDAKAPARLVVLNSNDTPPGAKPTELTGACRVGRVPAVMATIDLRKGVDLDRISSVLDECWRKYMAQRPSNADNLTFSKEHIAEFKQVDATIRRLAKEGRLLAPGGRKLLRGATVQASAR